MTAPHLDLAVLTAGSGGHGASAPSVVDTGAVAVGTAVAMSGVAVVEDRRPPRLRAGRRSLAGHRRARRHHHQATQLRRRDAGHERGTGRRLSDDAVVGVLSGRYNDVRRGRLLRTGPTRQLSELERAGEELAEGVGLRRVGELMAASFLPGPVATALRELLRRAEAAN